MCVWTWYLLQPRSNHATIRCTHHLITCELHVHTYTKYTHVLWSQLLSTNTSEAKIAGYTPATVLYHCITGYYGSGPNGLMTTNLRPLYFEISNAHLSASTLFRLLRHPSRCLLHMPHGPTCIKWINKHTCISRMHVSIADNGSENSCTSCSSTLENILVVMLSPPPMSYKLFE